VSCGNIIAILHGLIHKQDVTKDRYFSLAHQEVPFYALAERLLYISAYLRDHIKDSYQEFDAFTLINELSQLYDDYEKGMDVKKRAVLLQRKECIKLGALGRNHVLLQKAREVDERGIGRFNFYVFDDELIMHHEMTKRDVEDLCVYLRAHPEVDDLYFSLQLDLDSLRLLLSVPSVKTLYLHEFQANDETAAVFAAAPYLKSLGIDAISKKQCMSIQGLKILSSNLNLEEITVVYEGQPEEEGRQWAAILSEQDPIKRAQYGDEARAYQQKEQQKMLSQQLAVSVRKFSLLNEHVKRLELQLEHAGHGKRGRQKRNMLQSQLSVFRQQIQEAPDEVSRCYIKPLC